MLSYPALESLLLLAPRSLEREREREVDRPRPRPRERDLQDHAQRWPIMCSTISYVAVYLTWTWTWSETWTWNESETWSPGPSLL